jgi:dimethylargininase
MRVALTRKVSTSIGQCELTHLRRAPIDASLAAEQHESYERQLASFGCHLISLPQQPALPDAVFVEDTAVVLDEVAVITRPGAESRRPETQSIAKALEQFRALAYIHGPGTVDGGDVLRLGRNIYVGLSSRSSQSGIDQLQAAASKFGYLVAGVPVSGCLHLKSAVTQVSPDTLLINPEWVSREAFPAWRFIEVAPGEDYAANALLVGDKLIYPTSFPRTKERVQNLGIEVAEVDVSELQKAEGAVTCCSVVFSA